MTDFDFSPEELQRQVEAEREAIARELSDAKEDAYASTDDLMSATDYEGPDIFTPPDNVPALTQAEHNELTQIVSGQNRAWDMTSPKASPRTPSLPLKSRVSTPTLA